MYISSSSCLAISTDIPDPLLPLLPIVHRFQLVLRTTSCIYTELLCVGSSWSPCLCSAMSRGPQEYIIYELRMSGYIYIYIYIYTKDNHEPSMIHTQTTYINRIALRTGKKEARPAEVGALASVFEKSATELKKKNY